MGPGQWGDGLAPGSLMWNRPQPPPTPCPRCACGSLRGCGPGADATVGHGQPAWMPCFLADERSTPWAGLAWLQLALPGEGSQGQVSASQPGPHWPAGPLSAPSSSCSTSSLQTSPDTRSRVFPYLCRAVSPNSVPAPPPQPPLLWGSSEAMEGPTLEEPEVSRPLVVLTPTSAPAAIPCGS